MVGSLLEGVEGAVDDGRDHALGVMVEEGLLEDRLSRPGFLLAATASGFASKGVVAEYSWVAREYLRIDLMTITKHLI